MSDILTYTKIPAVALRGLVLFPGMRFQFDVVRKKSVQAIQKAFETDKKIFLVTQVDATVYDPEPQDLYEIGVVGEIHKFRKRSDSDVYQVIIETLHRAKTINFIRKNPYFSCNVTECKDVESDIITDVMIESSKRSIKDIFSELLEYTSEEELELNREVISDIFLIEDPGKLADSVARATISNFTDRQTILSELVPYFRLERLYLLLNKELSIAKYERTIEKTTEAQMEKNQKEYYLREKMRAISKELGEAGDVFEEVETYKEKIAALTCSDEIKEKLLYECSKLAKMNSNGADASVTRIYLDTALSLPFGVYSEESFDIERAKKILDDDHYGLKKVKSRFIEMLAVKKRTQDIKGQIICLVGPPGVGKTSIVKSVAHAMGREYIRLSLGGLSDEAEIRGHRKTYVGAMVGRIANALIQAKTMNPIVLLDEIDKLGKDYKGDPSSALLEVLDPEQNSTFRDNYLEFNLDLSKVLFITTANDPSTIPGPLYDRMEVIELTSYTPEEKLMIAKNHLIKKQLKIHGLNGNNVRFSNKIIRFIIDCYTREAGVRRLEQVIASICRKCALKLEEEETSRLSLNEELVKEFLGPEKFANDEIGTEDLVGVVNGLAWTSVGGTLLQLETITMPGNGKFELTGSLGDVMKESASIALSFIRSVAYKYDIDADDFKNLDIHIHAPEGAVPKDGPSAGVTMATALLSAFTHRKVYCNVAMTGEISLTGRVMKIGGLKEKSMAAYKAGIKKIIIPKDNLSDLWEIDDVVKDNVEFIGVSRVEEVFETALHGVSNTAAETSLRFSPKTKTNNINSNRRKNDEI